MRRLGLTCGFTLCVVALASCSGLPTSVPWGRQLGGSGSETALALAESPANDQVFVAAQTTGSFTSGSAVWLLVVNKLAEVVSQQVLETDRAETNPVLAPASDGGVFLAATTYSFSARGADALLARLDDKAQFRWQLRIGSQRDDIVSAVTATASGDMVAVGHTLLPGTADTDAMLIRLSGTADVEQAKIFGSTASERLYGVASRSDGGVYVVGQVNDTSGDDALVARISATGELLWAKRLSGDSNEGLRSVAITEGGWLAVGGTDLTPTGTSQALLVRGDEDGQITAQEVFTAGTSCELHTILGGPAQVEPWLGGLVTEGAGKTRSLLVRVSASGVLSGFSLGGDGGETALRLRGAGEGQLWLGFTSGSFGAQQSDLALLRTEANGFLSEPLRKKIDVTKVAGALQVVPSSIVGTDLATEFRPTSATLKKTVGRLRPIAGQ